MSLENIKNKNILKTPEGEDVNNEQVSDLQLDTKESSKEILILENHRKGPQYNC